MPRVDFHVQIDQSIKARVESLAQRLTVDMDELVEFLVKRWVERIDPDEPDVTMEEVMQERRLDNGVKASLRGETIPHEQVMAEIEAEMQERRSRGQ